MERLNTLVAQTVKRLPTTWETRVQSLGQEDLLEKEMATHTVLLSGKSHGRRTHSPWGHKESDTTEPTSLTKYTEDHVMITANTY